MRTILAAAGDWAWYTADVGTPEPSMFADGGRFVRPWGDGWTRCQTSPGAWLVVEYPGDLIFAARRHLPVATTGPVVLWLPWRADVIHPGSPEQVAVGCQSPDGSERVLFRSAGIVRTDPRMLHLERDDDVDRGEAFTWYMTGAGRGDGTGARHVSLGGAS